MPAAANWELLFNFEDLIESAAKAVLTAASISGLNIYSQQDVLDVATPAVSLQFTVRGAVEHYGFRSDGERFVDLWEGTLEACIETDRAKARAGASQGHAALRAECRRHLSSIAAWNAVAAVSLPYHVIWKVLEGASTPKIEADKDRDISVISFNIMFGVRPGAWPVPV